ncbi:MAG: hypothetical protein KDK99_14565 [Verrucomicrobiales bacterium]|nr:hypothetical protein [Verrucomicrobiales bacterium]
MNGFRVGVWITVVLWLLLCLRFWLLVGRRNPGQRHLIAIGAGLGGAMIYLLGGVFSDQIQSLQKEREARSAPASSGEVEAVRIHAVSTDSASKPKAPTAP